MGNPNDALIATYYVTASACTTTDPGSGVLLSAVINDQNVNVTFSPNTSVVTSSATTPGSSCNGTLPQPIASNIAGYNYGFSTTCFISMSLADGGSLSFVTNNDEFGFATSFTSVNFSPGNFPSWTLTATPSPASFSNAGQAIAYGYKLTNTGNVTINSIALTGTKIGTVSCLATTLAAGANTTCTSSYTTVAGDVGASIPYNVKASGTPTAGTLADAVANGSITFAAQPALTIAATPNPTSFSNAGQAIAYSYKLTNTGNVTINSLAVTGTKTGTVSCLVTTLAAGANTTCSSSYTTVAGDVGASIPYNVKANGTPTAGTLADAVANGSIIFAAQPALTIAATPNPTSFSNAGQAIAYGYKLTNIGNVTVNSLAVTGTKIGTVSCLATTLAAGANTTCSSSYTTVAGDVGASIPYNVKASGTPTAGTLADAVANGSITFAAQPALTIAATPNPTSFSNAGQGIGYSYTLTNAGNVTINSIAVTGTKTGAISCPATTLAAGANTTCTSSYTTVAGDVGASIPYNVKASGTPTAGTLADAVANGSITFAAQPALTIAATPNPTSFNNAGQAIAYSYKLTNTGNVTINSLAVTGTKTGTVSCLATMLAAGANTTCSSSYTTVAGDVGASIPYNVKASGTPTAGTLADAVANGSITFTAQPALTIAATPNPTSFSKAGQVISYTYKATNTGNVTINSLIVSDTKVSGITCAATTLSFGATTTCSGNYTTTAADVMAASISSTAKVQGMFGATPVASPPVATTVQIDANAVRQATQSAIRNFMNRRAEMVAAMQPDESRKHQRLPGWLFGNSNEKDDPQQQNKTTIARGNTDTPGADDRMARRPVRGQPAVGEISSDRTTRMGMNPFGLNGSTDDDGGGRFAFATSLAKLRQSAEATRTTQESGPDAPMGLGASQRTATGRTAEPSRFDVWAEGAMSYYSDTSIGAKQQGHAALMFMGVDYRIHPAILVGALVQLDWVSETTSALGLSASGQGWMAGPYVSVRLTRNLFFDARAAWGQADNRIDPLGVYTDRFSTERSLASAKLTGNWSYGQLQFRPSAEVVYFHETQNAYTNQINILIPEQSVSLGRLSVGPEIGYRFQQDNGATFEPYFGVKGIWDFDKTADTTVAGIAVGHDPFHVMVELGATYATPSGISLRGSLAYDGIGDSDLRAYYGRGSITVPFN